MGILTGAASVVRIIKWALDKHRPIMIFLIIGMMIGSFYAIIMGPMTLETPKDPSNCLVTSVIYGLSLAELLFMGCSY